MSQSTTMSAPHSSEELRGLVESVLGKFSAKVTDARGEVTVGVSAADYLAVMECLKADERLCFDQLVDLCGVDYSAYEGRQTMDRRYAVVAHLLSVQLNHRVRVRALCDNDDFPRIDSVCAIWSSASWYEREAFDLYGIVFDGHEDLRRILTDYGFIGHPFRKDFPLSGYVEMRYDADRQRVVYEPVSIEPRENTPRIVREENYGGLH